MNTWGVEGERNGGGLQAWRLVGAQNRDVVSAIVTFVDNSNGENTGYKIRVGENSFTDTKDGRNASSTDRSNVNTAINSISTLDRPKIVAFLPKLTTSLNRSTSQRWNLDTVRTLLKTKGISLEELNSKLNGVSLDGLTDDQIIEIALKAAGCTTEEVYGAQSQTVKDGHNTALTALETKAAAYKALLEKTNPPATPQEIAQAKTAYEAALTAFQTATKTGTTFNADQLPDALKGKYNTATSGVATAVTARNARTTPPTPTPTRQPIARRPATRPAGLNANGQRIWQQLSDRGITVSAANVARINDGTISKEDAVALGLVSQADQAGVFTAYNKTDTDQVWDADELGRYLDVVKTVSEKSGRPISQVLETFRNTRYLVTVNFDQIGTALSGIGTAGCANVNWSDKAAAAAAVEQNLTGKVEANILKGIKDRIAAGTITNQSQLEQYLFNAMMGSMTGDYTGWGVEELQGKVSAFKPRSAEQTGEDLTTWVKTGKSPDASATGAQEGEGYRRAMTALQERGKTYSEAIAVYNTGEHSAVLKGNPQAIDYIVDLAIKEGKYTEVITFLKDQTLTAEQKRDIYRKIVEKQTQKIQDMLGASPPNISGAKIELENLKKLVESMGADGTGHQGQIHSITLTIAGQLAQRNTGTDRADAYTLIDAIPPEAEFNHGRDQNAVVIHGRLEARFFLASSIKDKQPMTNFLANQPAGTTAIQRGYAQYYLAKAGESPRTKQELEATLEIYKKSAEAIKDDTSTQADQLRAKLEAEMRQLIDQYQRDHQTESTHTMQGLRDKYINKMPRPGGTTTPSTGGSGGGRARPVS